MPNPTHRDGYPIHPAYLLVQIDGSGNIINVGVYSEESPTVGLPSVWACITKVQANKSFQDNMRRAMQYAFSANHLRWAWPYLERLHDQISSPPPDAAMTPRKVRKP